MADTATLPSIAEHGAPACRRSRSTATTSRLKDDEGFIGDRASKGAFRDILENWRKPVRKDGDDPFGDEPSEESEQEGSSTRC